MRNRLSVDESAFTSSSVSVGATGLGSAELQLGIHAHTHLSGDAQMKTAPCASRPGSCVAPRSRNLVRAAIWSPCDDPHRSTSSWAVSWVEWYQIPTATKGEAPNMEHLATRSIGTAVFLGILAMAGAGPVTCAVGECAEPDGPVAADSGLGAGRDSDSTGRVELGIAANFPHDAGIESNAAVEFTEESGSGTALGRTLPARRRERATPKVPERRAARTSKDSGGGPSRSSTSTTSGWSTMSTRTRAAAFGSTIW